MRREPTEKCNILRNVQIVVIDSRAPTLKELTHLVLAMIIVEDDRLAIQTCAQRVNHLCVTDAPRLVAPCSNAAKGLHILVLGLVDEDAIDAEAKKKKIQEEQKKKAEEELKANQRTKAKKMDYEEQFAKRQAALQGIKPDTSATDGKDTQGMSEAAKGLLLQQQ